MSTIRILNGNNRRLVELLGSLTDKVEMRQGDAVLTCDPVIDEEVAVSRQVFEALLTGGYLAYKVDEKTKANHPIRDYNPADNAMVVMFGPVAGG
jgi:hypothetical protein